MKINNHIFTLIIITIIFIVSSNADKIDDSESFCSTDPDGSCSIPSNISIINPFENIKNLFFNIFSGYTDKINKITKDKEKRRIEEFKIQENSGIEKINSTNYQKLINGTWLVQIYSPWCPYSLHFQKTWRKVVKDVQTLSKLMIEGKISFDNDKSSEKESDNEKDKEKEKEKEDEELIMKKKLVMKNLKYAVVDAYESVDVAALLEVKGFPTIKMLHNGNAVTFTNSTSHDRLVKFALEDWMNQEWYNRLPKSSSKLYQLQIQFSLLLYKIMYHLDGNIFVPFKYASFGIFLYLAYNINIFGKIRYGLNHLRQYFSAFVPEILDLE